MTSSLLIDAKQIHTYYGTSHICAGLISAWGVVKPSA